MRRRLVPPPSWPRVVGAWALLLPGVVAFQPTFGGPAGYLASAVGVTLGAGIALAAVGLGWSIALWALALLAAYFLVGGPLALPDTTVLGVLPSLETLRELALLIPFGWRDLLTVATPAGDFAGPAAVPLLAGLLAGTVAVGLARATRAVFLPLLVAPCWLAFAIAFGVRAAPTAVWLGAALGAGILAWATAHRLAAHRSASAQFLVRREKGVSRPTLKVVAAAAVIALAAGVAVAANVSAEDRVNRQVLRDDVVPPLNLHEYPSPLMKYRLYELTEKDEVLFRVQGMPEGARLRLAVMDTFDGNVFTVSRDAGQFVRSGRELPLTVEGETRETRVEAVGYDDVWLPTAGLPTWLSFDGDRARALRVRTADGQDGTIAGSHFIFCNGTLEIVRFFLSMARAGGVPWQTNASIGKRFQDHPCAKIGTAERKIATLARVPLLIIDDFGLKPMRPPADEDFHDLIAERYEQAATIVTSNLDFSEWDQAFPANRLLAAATLDRLRHNAYCLTLDGASYRSPKMAPATPKSRLAKQVKSAEI